MTAFTGNWNYATPASQVDPLTGEVQHPDTEDGLWFSKTDADAGDRASELATVTAHSRISVDGSTWSVASGTIADGSHAIIPLVPGTSQLTTDGLKSFTITPAGVLPTLDEFRVYVGAASTSDDQNMQEALDSATAWVVARIYPEAIGVDECNQAILILASRLYKRRQSPEGVAGFASEGFVARIGRHDPDVKAMMERINDWSLSDTGVSIG